ncbi:MAG TPA: hypothetical protein V6D20_23390, partial [Candidatus Obscuribacterales bacterium]
MQPRTSCWLTLVPSGSLIFEASLTPANPQDVNGCSPDDKDFDPSNIRIPEAGFQQLTEAKKQYWSIKRKHFDKIIFYQQGDFFNIFEHDADLGHRLFGLQYNPKLRSVGVNRSHYDRWAQKFVAAGYKVMRIEQATTAVTNTAKAAKKNAGKKTEDRRVGQVLTAGTLTDDKLIKDYLPAWLLLFIEEENKQASTVDIGFCLVDVSTSLWMLGHFNDDEHLSSFETLLSQTRPKEILHLPGATRSRAWKVIRRTLGSAGYQRSTIHEYASSDYAHELLSKKYSQERPEAFAAFKGSSTLAAWASVVEYLGSAGIELHRLEGSTVLNYNSLQAEGILTL